MDDVRKGLFPSSKSHLIVEKIDRGVSKYPTLLREIPQPPAQIYVRGTFRELDLPAIAIVGTRRCTAYGEALAKRFAAELVDRGITIVSGLAQGIDQAAHEGALAAGGPTVAVVPAEMMGFLYRATEVIQKELLLHGALISEFDDNFPTQKWHFPNRNRIISGLSLGVLVIEAPEKSGALITTRHAGNQGREVFAIPGDITRESSQGTNKLIQDGAKLVTCVDDILHEIPAFHFDNRKIDARRKDVPALTVPEEAIKMILSDGPLTQDEVMEGFAGEPAECSIALFQLEGRGKVTRADGKIRWVP